MVRRRSAASRRPVRSGQPGRACRRPDVLAADLVGRPALPRIRSRSGPADSRPRQSPEKPRKPRSRHLATKAQPPRLPRSTSHTGPHRQRPTPPPSRRPPRSGPERAGRTANARTRPQGRRQEPVAVGFSVPANGESPFGAPADISRIAAFTAGRRTAGCLTGRVAAPVEPVGRTDALRRTSFSTTSRPRRPRRRPS